MLERRALPEVAAALRAVRAHHAALDGGVTRVDVKDDPLGWRVSVTDQGPGIPPERRAALFQAFSRGETHGQPGMGLGLNIASHAARLLGSELSLESTPGKGATFSFAVPPANPDQTM